MKQNCGFTLIELMVVILIIGALLGLIASRAVRPEVGRRRPLYTRYNHVFPPNYPSCLLGGTIDYDSRVIVTATSRHPSGVNMATVDGAVRQR